jgi:SAM-dependent methyltransferase
MVNTNIYNIKEKYDLVTSVASLEHFDFDRIFEKISSILNKNGIFIMMVDYWWYTLNSTGIFSKKPYATQMLTYNELEREIKKNNPAILDNLFKYYNYFHLGTKRPIVDDYIKKAKMYGLKFQSSQRLVPSDRIETRVSNEASPNKLNSKELNQILSSISRFKDGVTIEDLHTMYVLMIFQK